ncbi:hypothetical protein [Lentzea albidocapillata]|uniref:Uncharacterized protein n=1 Tax=Lentzea albidocapillata TaxID=40571 RepID=A0A1W2BYZ7_9PSEU|nr:hypothetical protein [Lentzea albidocapillata]SMC78217.1 hypothetical protein SAMN05660733_01665 [Lentzea albidocapillata]
MNDTRRYAIGEVAHRTGLSVSAIRLLVAIIDGTAQEAADFIPFAWLSAALNASVSPLRATRECPPHGDVPEARNP